MIKQAELQQAYLLGRQAAMEKVANVSVTETNNMNNLGLALGGGALAYQGLRDARLPELASALSPLKDYAAGSAMIGLNKQMQRVGGVPAVPRALMPLFDQIQSSRLRSGKRGLETFKNLVASNKLKSLAGLGAVGLGTYGAYKGLSHLLGND